jgi:integrase
MNFVEPIRDKRKISQIKNQLRGQGRARDLLLFTVGVNSALRISDLLTLTVGDFVDATGSLRSEFTLKEQKTGKRYVLTINNSIQEAWQFYAAKHGDVAQRRDNAVFFNLKSGDGVIQRGQAWRLIQQVCKDVGLNGEYGTHTLRKTWGYHARLAGVDLATIMRKFNHSRIDITMRYLGITDDEMADAARRINL